MMKKIILVFDPDEKKIEHILGANLAGGSSRLYMKFKDTDGSFVKKLTSMGFHKINFTQHYEQYKEKFLREYVDLIGRNVKEINTLAWRATDIASKNRFFSRVTDLLSQFLDIMEATKTYEIGIMVVVNPDWTIVSSLKKACLNDNIDCIIDQNFVRKRIIGLFTGKSWHLARAFKHIFIIFFPRWLLCRLMLGKKIKEIISAKEPYYVVKTFVYEISFSRGHIYKDVFFGKLPDLLAKNMEVLIFAHVFGNNITHYYRCLQEMKQCGSHRIIPVESFVEVGDLVSILLAIRFLFAKIKIVEEKCFFGHDVSGIIKNELARTLNGIQFYHLLYYWFVKRLLKNVEVDTFLLTYENNPWEKMCIIALREASPKTKIPGYQHTVVTQASANMFRSRFEKDSRLFPDKILTVGEAPKRIIQRYGDSPYGWVNATYGWRFEYLFGRPELERKKRGNILLALEGIKEVELMVSFVLRALNSRSNYHVRIRTHRNLRWEYFQKRGLSIAGRESFQLSETAPLMEDLEWADIVIYWGSTVALEALSLGLPVIHYQNGSLLSLDPLFECGHLKWNVSEDVSLVKIIEEIYAMADTEFYSQREKAQAYLKNYFHPINEKNIAEFFTRNAIKTT